MIVKQELDKLQITHGAIDLGEVELKGKINLDKMEQLKAALLKTGLELMDDQKAILIQKIKNIIVEMVHYSPELPKLKNSEFLSEKMGYDYTYISNLFAIATGITVEQYIIIHKIERVKELLLYNELNLTEISYKLNYSSVAHLSNQFKKITGLTPSYFKQLKKNKRLVLENL